MKRPSGNANFLLMEPVSGAAIATVLLSPAIPTSTFTNLQINHRLDNFSTEKPLIRIEYCPKCRWMLRAAYMAQEFLSTFEDVVSGVMLAPSDVNGRYTIFV